MKTFFRYIRPRLPYIALVFLFLMLRAWCELSLPGYTSDIVNVGIARGGVAESVPDALPAEEYDRLYALDPDAMAAYSASDGVYTLTGEPTQALESLIAAQGAADERYTSPTAAYILNVYESLGRSRQSIQMGYILRTGLKMLSRVLLGAGCAICLGYVSAYVATSLSRDMRRDVYARVLSFSPSEFDSFSTASLITRSTNDIQQLQIMLNMSMRMVAYSPILAIGGIIKVVEIAPSMGWIIALAVAIIAVLLVCLFSVTMPKFKLLQTLVDKVNLVSREVLSGLPVIRAFGAEERETERFEAANTDLTNTGLFVNRTMAAMMPTMNLVMNGTTLLIVWIGAHQIGAGVIQVGDMMAFITYATQIIMSFLMLGMISVSAPRALVSINRVSQVLETRSSILDPESPLSPDPAKAGLVEFDHVDFSYPGADEKVLTDITFTALPGQTTAIIGSTGCGKTTVVSLIPRFFDVTGGEVRVEGVDVRRLSQHDLRARVGFVPQKSVLFSGTIASNIAFSDPDMSQEDMAAAAETAQAVEFISQKEQGYDAPIAQGGSNVSGGQKQRLAIARALAKKAPIYVFDDSFSALDYKTDRALRAALKERMSGATVLLVAQRISTVLNADKIIVLDDGRIVGMGTHRELMQTCEEYRQIALSQLSKEELANG